MGGRGIEREREGRDINRDEGKRKGEGGNTDIERKEGGRKRGKRERQGKER